MGRLFCGNPLLKRAILQTLFPSFFLLAPVTACDVGTVATLAQGRIRLGLRRWAAALPLVQAWPVRSSYLD